MKRGKILWVICIMFCAVLFSACYHELIAPPRNDTVRVVLTDGENYTCKDNVMDVRVGEDVVLDIEFGEEFVFDSCNYAGEYVVTKSEKGVEIALKDVRFDTRITVATKRIAGKIFYYLNGGSFVDETKVGENFSEAADTTNHLRVNTNIGTGMIYRDGYTQLGWNMKEDGSGEHVGLGSRVTVTSGTSVYLYAEWIKWTDVSLFTYQPNEQTEDEDDISLTSYLGGSNVEKLVIPAKIDGKTVTDIAMRFSDKLRIGTLIFPNTLQSVRQWAFGRSKINEIYFFDNVQEISDSCFGGPISTVHINAVLSPRHSTEDDNAQFAENMDRLILNADKKKMIFFAGCSMSYGLDSSKVERAFRDEYVICNMGVIGGTNATFQFDCITKYLGEDDVFIHAPEQMSVYQLMHNVKAETRMFVCTESNYDLLSFADLSNAYGFFDCFRAYNEGRSTLEERSYKDHNTNYNAYGDYAIYRPNSPHNAKFDLSVRFDVNSVNENSVNRLNGYYNKIVEKGTKVFFSFAPINHNAMTEEDRKEEIWNVYAEKLKNGLDERVKIISNVEDYIIEGRYFYDADYHLTNDGALMRTDMIVRDIERALKE